MKFQDKVVLVTGGAQGIGKAIVERFTEEGAKVVIADIQEEKGKETAERIGANGHEVVAIKTDITHMNEVERMIEFTMEKFGRLDILVNNAGVQIRCPSVEFPENDWDKLMNINLKAVFFVSQAAAKVMIKQGGGNIVNISSMAVCKPLPERAPYTISKAGVKALTEVLAAEWAKYGIRVNCVLPGWIHTQMVEDGFKAGVISKERIHSVTPMRRLASTREIANGVLFLASDEASFVTGHPLHIDGGWTVSGMPETTEK